MAMRNVGRCPAISTLDHQCSSFDGHAGPHVGKRWRLTDDQVEAVAADAGIILDMIRRRESHIEVLGLSEGTEDFLIKSGIFDIKTLLVRIEEPDLVPSLRQYYEIRRRLNRVVGR